MALVTPVDTVPVDQLGRVHFIGIGGAGMSGIARVMLARGVPVSGSDAGSAHVLAELAALGADVHTGHDAAHLGQADTVVVSSAIRPTNPELAAARERNLRVLPRAAALASIMIGRRATAIAGTHGKTTTTSMLTTILRECGAEPGYVIGGVLAETGRGADDGVGPDLVVEADESDGSFLMLSPYVAVITNVEADHLDNYSGLEEIRAAFEAFGRRITPGGALITCADDAGARTVADASRSRDIRVRSYGTAADADYRVSQITPRGMDSTFVLTAGPESTDPFERTVTIAVPGRHNVLNAAAALAPAHPRRHGARRARPAGRRGAGRLPGRAPPDGAQGRGRRGPGAGQLCAPPDRGRSRSGRGPGPGRRGKGGGGVPAPPVQPDPHLRHRPGRGAGPGRRGGGAGHLRGPGRPRTRRHRPAGGRCGPGRTGSLPARPAGRGAGRARGPGQRGG